jgi:hypothetical protein
MRLRYAPRPARGDPGGGVEFRQLFERVVKGGDFGGAAGAEIGQLVQVHRCGVIHAVQLAAAFAGGARSGGVGENSAHQAGAEGEEVRAVVPLQAARIRQLQIRFVHQGRGLKGVSGALAAHAGVRHAVELALDERGQEGQCVLVAGGPGLQ